MESAEMNIKVSGKSAQVKKLIFKVPGHMVRSTPMRRHLMTLFKYSGRNTLIITSWCYFTVIWNGSKNLFKLCRPFQRLFSSNPIQHTKNFQNVFMSPMFSGWVVTAFHLCRQKLEKREEGSQAGEVPRIVFAFTLYHELDMNRSWDTIVYKLEMFQLEKKFTP